MRMVLSEQGPGDRTPPCRGACACCRLCSAKQKTPPLILMTAAGLVAAGKFCSAHVARRATRLLHLRACSWAPIKDEICGKIAGLRRGAQRILRTKTVARGGREGAVWAPPHLREFCALRPWRAAAARAPFGRPRIRTGAQWGEKGACHFGGWKSHGKGQILLF